MIKHFRVAGGLRVRLEEAGVPVPAVPRGAGLPQNLFEQTRILVSTEELFALWRAMGDVSKDASIGVRLGTETSIARFHPSGLAALSTESFGAAIDHMARYKRLSVPEEILHETMDNEWAILPTRGTGRRVHSGSDFLRGGCVTAACWFGDLALK